jgi:hypothetical protein
MPINPKSLKNLRPRVPGVEREKLTTTLLPDVKKRIKLYCVANHTTCGELFERLFTEMEAENQEKAG